MKFEPDALLFRLVSPWEKQCGAVFEMLDWVDEHGWAQGVRVDFDKVVGHYPVSMCPRNMVWSMEPLTPAAVAFYTQAAILAIEDSDEKANYWRQKVIARGGE